MLFPSEFSSVFFRFTFSSVKRIKLYLCYAIKALQLFDAPSAQTPITNPPDRSNRNTGGSYSEVKQIQQKI